MDIELDDTSYERPMKQGKWDNKPVPVSHRPSKRTPSMGVLLFV
jgi:hypothetical protein